MELVREIGFAPAYCFKYRRVPARPAAAGPNR